MNYKTSGMNRVNVSDVSELSNVNSLNCGTECFKRKTSEFEIGWNSNRVNVCWFPGIGGGSPLSPSSVCNISDLHIKEAATEESY